MQGGGGGWSTIVGGGGKKRLTFPGFKAASDVELQPICFFDSEKNWREPDLWTLYPSPPPPVYSIVGCRLSHQGDKLRAGGGPGRLAAGRWRGGVDGVGDEGGDRRRVARPPQDVRVRRGERGAGGEGGAGRGLLAHAPGRRRQRTPAEAIVVGGDDDGLGGDDGDGESPSLFRMCHGVVDVDKTSA